MIDLDGARVLLATVRDREGAEFVYATGQQDCYYEPQAMIDDEDPRNRVGCIVGEAIKLGDPKLYELIRGSQRAIDEAVRMYTGASERISNEAVTYFAWAQSSQDNGNSWGEATREAENNVVPTADRKGLTVKSHVKVVSN